MTILERLSALTFCKFVRNHLAIKLVELKVSDDDPLTPEIIAQCEKDLIPHGIRLQLSPKDSRTIHLKFPAPCESLDVSLKVISIEKENENPCPIT